MLALTNLLATGQVSQTMTGRPPDPQLNLPAAQQRIQQLEGQLSSIHAMQSRQLLVGSVIALTVMVVISVLLGRAIAGRVLRPLRTITAATRRITAENLHERLALSGTADEVTDLADTIDGLLERLEASFSAQRRFVANAAHELRTPLTTMRASLDVTAATPQAPSQTLALADRVRAELDRVDHLLDGFLALAHVDHGAVPDHAPVSLGTLVSASLVTHATAITDKNLTITADTVDSAWTRGSPTLLSRLADNVIDNAIVHNHPDGWIRIETSTGGATVHLAVETGGPILDPVHVARLAQPFQRLATERTGSETGSGLGLSIVAAIASAHDGHLDLHARPDGGLHVAVTVPSAPAMQDADS